MGYDVNWFLVYYLKKEVSYKQLEDAFKEKIKTDSDLKEWEDSITFNGGIDFYDYSCKYNEERFYALASFLAPYLTADSYFEFKGEDDSIWAFIFDGTGGWSEQQGTILYDYHPYKTFIKQFEDKLPKELKEQLDKWYLGIQVLEEI